MEIESRFPIQADKSAGRPYRSHLFPACLPCKKRKSRCRNRDSSGICIMCYAHGTECIFPQADEDLHQRPISSPRKIAAKARHSTPSRSRSNLWTSSSNFNYQRGLPRPAADISLDHPERTIGSNENNAEDTLSNLAGIVAESGDNSSHIISPAVAEDSHVLESYLSTVPDTRRSSLIRPSPSSSRLVRPVLFNTVLRRPLGHFSNQSLPATKCEIIEKYLEPVLKDVVSLFFQYANVCFPVFDEPSFQNIYNTHKEKISPALLCNLYANSLIYWENSPILCSGRSPDIRYIWNQANEALHSELFLSPGISTVMAIILNVCGRPSTSIFGNGGMVGTAVALSNALGLNRDPSNWNISPLEKRFRIRIWWLIVVLDRWCSLAYGTPLQIHRAQYDVPFPTVDDIRSTTASPSHTMASEVFIALITLTEVLGEYLEHVYKVSQDVPYPPKTSAFNLERPLSNWEESLSNDIRRIILRGTHLNNPGAANFRLAYLAVKLLLRRLQLDVDKSSTNSEDDAASPFYMQAQRAAEEIVHLVQELDESHFRGFWLPVHSFSLTSATTFLLRSGLRKRNSSTNTPLNIAKEMVATLWSHRRTYNWDLADNCLANCSDLVEKISSSANEEGSSSSFFDHTDTSFQEHLEFNQSLLDELLTEIPGFADTS